MRARLFPYYLSRIFAFHVVYRTVDTRQASHVIAAAWHSNSERKYARSWASILRPGTEKSREKTNYSFSSEILTACAGWASCSCGRKTQILIYFASATFSVHEMRLAVDVSPSNMVLSVLCGHFRPTEKCFPWPSYGKWAPNGSVDTRRQRQPFSNATRIYRIWLSFAIFNHRTQNPASCLSLLTQWIHRPVNQLKWIKRKENIVAIRPLVFTQPKWIPCAAQ